MRLVLTGLPATDAGQPGNRPCATTVMFPPPCAIFQPVTRRYPSCYLDRRDHPDAGHAVRNERRALRGATIPSRVFARMIRPQAPIWVWPFRGSTMRRLAVRGHAPAPSGAVHIPSIGCQAQLASFRSAAPRRCDGPYRGTWSRRARSTHPPVGPFRCARLHTHPTPPTHLRVHGPDALFGLRPEHPGLLRSGRPARGRGL
jgi:hypothetical protein